MPETFELINEDIFDNMTDAVSVVCWLVHLAGGKIVFPVDEEFWLTNYPEGTRLVLRKEDGQLVMAAEKQVWQQSSPDDQ